MGIKDFYVETYELQWGKQEPIKLRGLTPDDITRLLISESENVEQIFNTLEAPLNDEQASKIDITNTAEVSALIADRAKPAMMGLLTQFPNVIAKVIAMAADEPDDWEGVKRWVIPMQMQALTEIARLTFIDAAGFETFVGNAVALAQAVRREPAPKNRLRSVG